MTARQQFDHGNRWTHQAARQALPFLLMLAKSPGEVWTYGQLEDAIDLPYAMRGDARQVQAVLATPAELPPDHAEAATRLKVPVLSAKKMWPIVARIDGNRAMTPAKANP